MKKKQKTVVISVRIDSDLKRKFACAVEQLGLTMSSAIRIVMEYVAMEGCLPFEVSLRELARYGKPGTGIKAK